MASDSVPTVPRIAVRAIASADVTAAARFLYSNLNDRISEAAWIAAIVPPWQAPSPNHGFMLVDGAKVVGVQLAYYSERLIHGQTERFCNVAAWCVAEGYRAHGFRLLAAVLTQKGYSFTDLSPSGNVIPLNTRLKFRHLDTRTSLVINWPWPSRGAGVSIVTDRSSIASFLSEAERAIYRDHEAACAAHHLVILSGSNSCYVIFRRDRRKGLPFFASVLYVGNPPVLEKTLSHFGSHLLIRHGIGATLLETRIAGFQPSHGHVFKSPRPKMYRSHLEADQIDYLYSELVSVPW